VNLSNPLITSPGDGIEKLGSAQDASEQILSAGGVISFLHGMTRPWADCAEEV